MPRKPRFYLPGEPVHVVQRGHSREPVFFENDDYHAYLGWLAAAAECYEVCVHAKGSAPFKSATPKTATPPRHSRML